MSQGVGDTDRRKVLKDALHAVEEMQARLEAAERKHSDPIAVVGLACRFPGDSDTPEAYWRLLRDGVDAIREVPRDRWAASAYAEIDPETAAEMPTQYGGFLSNVDRFDPHFFGIAPREALTLDPQQRLVLEVVWEALENAGQAPDRLRGSLTGVFVGITANDFAHYLKDVDPGGMDVYSATGTAHNSAAGRVSYTLGLNGPAMAVDTACSSGLTAIHLACQSLRLGESNLALAGGVQVMLMPDAFVAFHKWGMIAPDGRCKTFDEAADGFVRAEGCGVVVLKRLADAIADGDRIHAVVRGSAVNQDGASSGLTVPNGPAQEAVLRQALRAANVAPHDVAYVEAHGTGTTIGDPIELEAMDAVLSQGRPASRPLAVGSVKTNFGHLEAASGLAGFIKLVLSVEHAQIPPHLHFHSLSSKITLRHQPVTIPTALIPWPEWSEQRIGGVSSFGFSGTNVHVIVERAPANGGTAASSGQPHVVMLSAKTEPALRSVARGLDARLEQDPAIAIGDVALTLNTGRARFAHRVACVSVTPAQLREQLRAIAAGEPAAGAVMAHLRPGAGRPKVAFLFTGQGAQYAGMGRGLYDSEPVFREALDRCAQALGPDGRRLLSVMWGEQGTDGLLDQTQFTQPALFALEYGLSELWRSWGVVPTAVLGHSVGQFAAACVAGLFSVEDGVRMIAARARLMAELPAGGTMAAILADEARVREAVAKYSKTVAIAAINGPASVVISGVEADVLALQERFERNGVRTQRLAVSHAFHSPLMDPMLETFRKAVGDTTFAAPRLPLVSNVTGEVAGDEIRNVDDWVKHVRQPVRFKDGIETLRRLGHQVFVEIGPGTTLIGLGRTCVDGEATWASSLRRGRDDRQELLSAVGALAVRGVEPDWKALPGQSAGRKIELPTYPFERDRVWIDRDPARARPSASIGAQTTHPLLGRAVRAADGSVRFEQELSAETLPLVKDHVVHDTVVMPATALLDAALAAAAYAGDGPRALAEFAILEPLAIGPGQRRALVVRCGPSRDGRTPIEILSRVGPGDSGLEHVHATAVAVPASNAAPAVESLEAIAAKCVSPVDLDTYRASFRAAGLSLGPAFAGLTMLMRGEAEALGRVVLPAVAVVPGSVVQPALLDACFQSLGGALPPDRFDGSEIYVPVSVGRVEFWGDPGSEVSCQVVLRSAPAAGAETIHADIRVFDASSQLAGALDDLVVKRATRERLRLSVAQAAVGSVVYDLVWQAGAGRDAAPLAGRWVMWGGSGDVRDAIGRHFAKAGATVEAGPTGSALPDDVRGILHLGALGLEKDGRSPGEVEGQRAAIESLLDATKAAAACRPAPKLWIVTQGACAVRPGERVAVAQSTLWGVGRTIVAEQPELSCVMVDLDPGASAEECAAMLAREAGAPDREDQIAYRAAGRQVARLKPHRQESSVSRRLEITERGVLEGLKWKPATRRAPGEGEVEVRLAATGLNFRDVLNALGVYAGGEAPLGNECAGIVSAIGPGVTGLTAGDAVVGLADDCFADYAITSAALLARKPPALSWGEAATLPITFLTADDGLRRLAKVRRGERVLIHAAAGGVGLAAVQIAQQIGAEIFATAGSPEKHAHLRGLGVTHIFSSRSLDFAAAIRSATGGAGVDVVINSLTGDAIPKSLELLAPGGRFVEIGKAGIWTKEQVAAVRPDVKYWTLYLGDLPHQELGDRLRELVGEVAGGALRPLPRREFGADQAVDAFRFMAQARHIGKVVVLHAAPGAGSAAVRPDGSYLITGGTGGLGLVIAQALVDRGARHVVLASRSAGTSADASIARLRSQGAQVDLVAADVSGAAGVAAAIAAATAGGRTLRGIVHAAGVVDDALLTEQTWLRAAAVIAPKLAGAWQLHEASRTLPLDFFVLFSSTAAVLGVAGQAAYAAGNAFLDALAHHRRSLGLPASSINWGPWGEAGMAASIAERDRRRWSQSGVRFLSDASGIAAFEFLSAGGAAQSVVFDVDWPRYADARLGGRAWPFISALTAVSEPAAVSSSSGKSAATDVRQQLAQAAPYQRENLLRAHIRGQILRVLALDAAFVLDPLQGLTDLGMDSLMAVDLRNRLQATLAISLPSTLAFDCPTLDALTGFTGPLLDIGAPAAAPASQARTAISDREAVAIVGMACRFPGGSDSPDAFWTMLRNGIDAITEVPPDRWDIDAYYDPDQDAPGKMYTRHGGFIGGVDRFDATFFGISAREARSMDPQQRLLLETSWEALEHAGTAADRLRGSRTGVFVGLCTNDYGGLQLKRDASEMDAYFGTGNAPSVAAGRLSYVLGLQGPSLSIDTACSSSLVTVHLALQSLRRGECDLALAGGVNLMLSPEITVNFSRARMLAADGRCKTFDAAADGYVRSEGCGMVVLKRYSDALADGDPIVAIIRGSAVNQDGRSSGLTVPNGPAQQAVVREALQDAGIAPSEVGYVEAHGTGTSLGDPIELQALRAVLGEGRPPDRVVAMGSVKTNIGHLEAAAGVAGLIKTALALQHGEIPAHLHFTALNPQADMAGLPWTIPTSLTPWPAGYSRRVAGVSSFGFSGTNAHIVMEEPGAGLPVAARETAPAERPVHVLALSAKSAPALAEIAGRLREFAAANPEVSLVDLGFTVNTGRSHFGYRAALVAASAAELRRQLEAVAGQQAAPGVAVGAAERLERVDPVFIFGGEGQAPAGIARELYASEPTFREAIDRCRLIANLDGRLPASLELFAFEFALSEVWRSWGVIPAVVAGSGVGEYVAACLAGVFSLEDAVRLVVARAGFVDEPGSPAARTAFEQAAGEVAYAAPSIDFAPNAPGDNAGVATANYWRGQAAAPGLSAGTLDALRDRGRNVYVEIGSGASASSALSALGGSAVCVPSLDANADGWRGLSNAVARLYVEGVNIDWSGFDRPYARRRVAVPTYPFQRQRHWIEDAPAAARPDASRVFEHVEAMGRRQSQAGPLDLALHTYAARGEYLQRLTTHYEIESLRRFGVFTKAGDRHSVADLLDRCGIQSTYEKQLERWLESLTSQGFLVRRGNTFESPAPLPDIHVEPPHEGLGRDILPLLDYMHRCGKKLNEVLTGKESALETLFPGGSFDLAEFLYETSAVARYSNGIVRSVIEAAVSGPLAGTAGKVNILEVGAGTGGTTTAVLPALPADRAAYFFTDVSDFFLARAKRKFAAYPFVRYGLLDFEKDVQAQGFPLGGFDVVFGANTLHATADLRRALAGVRSLLAPGGLLVLLEVTHEQAWFDITTGLIEGWQKFTDGIRDDSPLLPPDRWLSVFAETGFDRALAFPEPGSPAEVLGLHVLVARVPPSDVLSAADVEGRRQLESLSRDAGGATRAERSGGSESGEEFRRQVASALDADRDEMLVAYVRDHVTAVLGDASGPPDRRHRLMDLGLDSLMAVELRNRLATGLALTRPLSATLMFDYPTIDAIAGHLAKEIQGPAAEAHSRHDVPQAQAAPAVSAADLADLTDEEVEELLNQRLESN